MPNTTDNFDIPFLDGTELVRDYPQFSEDLADAIDGNLLIGSTVTSNAALGLNALTSNTTGVANVAVGVGALQNNTTGFVQTAVGFEALQNSNGTFNTAVGRRALLSATSSNNTTGLGANSSSSSATVSNQVTLGDGNITSLRCNQTSISSLSDVRDKTDIVDTQHGLDTLNKIRPVDFTWARRDGTFGSAPDIGFIAQELASVEDQLGDAQRLRLTLRNNPEKLEATPGRLIPILVKAVQELSAKNDELEARIEALEAK